MRFSVPITVVVEASSPEKALDSARKIQELLNQSMVMMVLSTNGVDVKTIQVFQPKPA